MQSSGLQYWQEMRTIKTLKMETMNGRITCKIRKTSKVSKKHKLMIGKVKSKSEKIQVLKSLMNPSVQVTV